MHKSVKIVFLCMNLYFMDINIFGIFNHISGFFLDFSHEEIMCLPSQNMTLFVSQLSLAVRWGAS